MKHQKPKSGGHRTDSAPQRRGHNAKYLCHQQREERSGVRGPDQPLSQSPEISLGLETGDDGCGVAWTQRALEGAESPGCPAHQCWDGLLKSEIQCVQSSAKQSSNLGQEEPSLGLGTAAKVRSYTCQLQRLPGRRQRKEGQ